MSRSRRKNPIFGFTKAKSEKLDKQLASRAKRRISHMKERELLLDNDILFPQDKELSIDNVCNWSKDGKQYAPGYEKEMRK